MDETDGDIDNVGWRCTLDNHEQLNHRGRRGRQVKLVLCLQRRHAVPFGPH